MLNVFAHSDVQIIFFYSRLDGVESKGGFWSTTPIKTKMYRQIFMSECFENLMSRCKGYIVGHVLFWKSCRRDFYRPPTMTSNR
jgi:hypothetical protein